MHVPSEMLRMIFGNLTKSDLKSSRLTCKAWNVEVAPLLFDSVFVIARYADLEVADKIAKKYGRFVERLVYSLEFFEQFYSFEDYLQFNILDKMHDDEMEDDDYDDEEDSEEDGDEDDEVETGEWPSCYMAHTKQHYETYSTLQKEQGQILEKGMVFKQLCRVFTSMPNISKVVLTHSWNKRAQCWCDQAATDAQQRRHKRWKTTPACSEENCDSIRYHQGRCIKSLPPWYTPRKSIDWWKDLMRALDQSGKALPELVMEVTSKDDIRVPVEVFRTSSGLDDIMPKVFAQLTRLELSIDMEHEHGVDSDPWRSDGFNLAFSAARNLKILHVSLVNKDWDEVDGSEPANTDFSDLFAKCSFPKLQTLCIDRCTVGEEEVLRLARKSPELQSLVFRRCTLYGLWRRLVQRIRDDLNVKFLQLDWIRGHFDEDEEIGDLDVEELDLAVDQLMEFFLREKGSTFSREDLQRLADGTNDDLPRQVGKFGITGSASSDDIDLD